MLSLTDFKLGVMVGIFTLVWEHPSLWSRQNPPWQTSQVRMTSIMQRVHCWEDVLVTLWHIAEKEEVVYRWSAFPTISCDALPRML